MTSEFLFGSALFNAGELGLLEYAEARKRLGSFMEQLEMFYNFMKSTKRVNVTV